MGIYFSAQDEKRIEDEGLTTDKVLMQLEAFKKGVTFKPLVRPCSAGDGILQVSEDDGIGLVKAFDSACGQGRVTKFVPASGAASRMFRDWSLYLEKDCPASAMDEFFSTLARYPFTGDLKDAVSRGGYDFDSLVEKKDVRQVLRFALTPDGLNLGCLPKALIPFHAYPECPRTSLEEHLAEGALYAADSRGTSRLHITVSPEHETAVRGFLERHRPDYEKLFGVKYHLELSAQGSATNTMTVDLENNPVRDRQGNLLFRPGGHGALLPNLNSIDGDIIFIKNIDNVVKDALKPVTVKYKKLLGGYLVDIQKQVFDILARMSGSRELSPGFLDECAVFCRDKLNISLPPGWAGNSPGEKRSFLAKMMDRPLRVCGMVRNEGEPGGGPFWVIDRDGGESLQIVEGAQVDPAADEQCRIWSSASYFNPVDLVCGVRDFRGRKFDLGRFVDRDDYLISRKTQDNREVKALELPGLWNGSMARWNTIFIEVPIETFNPVKEVKDLLRPQHRP